LLNQESTTSLQASAKSIITESLGLTLIGIDVAWTTLTKLLIGQISGVINARNFSGYLVSYYILILVVDNLSCLTANGAISVDFSNGSCYATGNRCLFQSREHCIRLAGAGINSFRIGVDACPGALDPDSGGPNGCRTLDSSAGERTLWGNGKDPASGRTGCCKAFKYRNSIIEGGVQRAAGKEVFTSWPDYFPGV
jgi:hypothetical protein